MPYVSVGKENSKDIEIYCKYNPQKPGQRGSARVFQGVSEPIG
jgi:hypothetical protein